MRDHRSPLTIHRLKHYPQGPKANRGHSWAERVVPSPNFSAPTFTEPILIDGRVTPTLSELGSSLTNNSFTSTYLINTSSFKDNKENVVMRGAHTNQVIIDFPKPQVHTSHTLLEIFSTPQRDVMGISLHVDMPHCAYNSKRPQANPSASTCCEH